MRYQLGIAVASRHNTTNSTEKTIVMRESNRSIPRRVLKTVPVPPKTLPSPAPRAWSNMEAISAIATMMRLIKKYWRYGVRKPTDYQPLFADIKIAAPWAVRWQRTPWNSPFQGNDSIPNPNAQYARTFNFLYRSPPTR